MKTQLILPTFVLLICLVVLAMTRLPMLHGPAQDNCHWCGDDSACRWAHREDCR